MEAIIGGLTILAGLIAVYDGRLRRVMLWAVGVGAVALIGVGVYGVIPKPESPYQFLSISCGGGRTAPAGHEINPYVLLGGAIVSGVAAQYLQASKNDAEFATCLLRNEGSGPVYNVEIAFAYQPLPDARGRSSIRDFANGKIEWVAIPHVGIQGAYLLFESEVPTPALIAPTYSCTLEDPGIGRRRPCTLPPAGSGATSSVTQIPVPVFPAPTYAKPLSRTR